VSASVGGFPFLPRVVLASEVSSVGLHLENVQAEAIVFASIDIDLDGVHFDRGQLLNDRKARITSIDHGTVTATITDDALSTALGGVPVTMTPGVLTVAGVRVTPTATRRGLSVGAFAVPENKFVPCVSEVEVIEGALVASCELENIPPALLDVVQDAVDR
jgi:hypothetical protein